MTLDDVIIHCEEVADRCAATDGDLKCEQEHRQLAEWLKELKEFRSLLGTVESARWLYESWKKYGEVAKYE